ncbi:MAG TPA: helix-turn-helix domain-containing protein [Actinomycetota bacterium]|nr:helix-turn-helix domain-containing protein [Actinomycetota bacterium]
MTEHVKPRGYHAPRRQEQARRTRRAILDAATRLFAERAYSATTMTAVADQAGVALDTVYAAVGPKPVLFRLLVETAISGTDAPVPALERDYVRAIRAEPDAARKLTLYAQAIGRIQQRLAPLVQVLQQAAAGDAELAALWRGIADRRAANMRLLAAELAATGALRPELSVEEVADVLWSMNSPELYLLLVDQRGWDPDRYQRWLADAWQRLLLRPA